MSIRSESDSWDLATSVGATATMVAAQRALASDAGLIDDPFAAPLVRKVGIDVYTRLVNGEIPVTDEIDFDPARMGRGMAVRTRFYDRFFVDATRSGIRQVVIVAAGSGRPRLPPAVAARHHRLRSRPAGGHRVQDVNAERTRRCADG